MATSNHGPGPSPSILLSPDVADAVTNHGPVVALESTIFSELGLPAPSNREALKRVMAAVRSGGATPALSAIIDGAARIGLAEEAFDMVCGPARKVAVRDIGPALAQRWPYGATTVSASVALAAATGIEVFATGGIGGVHQGWSTTGDISADLNTLSAHPVVAVTAGAKVFLDLPATLEYLETASVPVIGWRCDEFPAFHAPSSGLPLTIRADSAVEVADIARRHWEFDGGGVVVAVPVPHADAIPLPELRRLVDTALAATGEADVSGPAITPAVLDQLAILSDGRTVTANLALAENNAAVASEIAVALSESATTVPD